MFKQDAIGDEEDKQIYVRTDNETASVNLGDPALLNLFSNLDQLIHLKDYQAGLYTMKLEYPRVTEDKPFYTWKQSSNPLTDSKVTGYVPIDFPMDASRYSFFEFVEKSSLIASSHMEIGV
jgi:hypothetical protein